MSGRNFSEYRLAVVVGARSMLLLLLILNANVFNRASYCRHGNNITINVILRYYIGIIYLRTTNMHSSLFLQTGGWFGLKLATTQPANQPATQRTCVCVESTYVIWFLISEQKHRSPLLLLQSTALAEKFNLARSGDLMNNFSRIAEYKVI